MSELTLGLLVPMNVEALVVPEGAHTEGANLKPDFRRVYRLREVLGQQLEAPPCWETTNPGLKGGIHLHWALPDGLAHGVAGKNGGRPEFPPIPNRWLIVRFWDQAGEKPNLDMQYKAWIVESDTVTTDTSAAVWPTLRPTPPSQKLEKNDYFVFVGKQFELSKWPEETKPPHVDITAVGYGDPPFAAYYPACKGILGFHDGEYAGLGEGACLSYMVVGWYSDPSKDPLQQSLTNNTVGNLFAKLDEFLRKTQWAYPGFPEAQANARKTQKLEDELKESREMLERLRKVKAPIDPSAVLELEKRIGTLDEDIQGCRAKNADLQNNLPAHILCHGIITGIRWERSPESGVPDPDEPFKIAMGDTAVESFGTLFEKALSGDLGKLLAVFQYDLLSELEKPGGVAIVDYKVHERSYRRLARGIRWDLMQESHPTFSGSPEDRSPPNPGDIRALLEQLNMRQGRINRLKRERDSLRSELYATWYKKVLNTAAQGKKASEDALNERLANLTTEIEGLTVKITELEEEGHPKGTEWEEIQRQLNTFLPGWKLQQFDEPEFWRPNDPVLLLAGKAFQRSRRHGEDGRFRSDGRLLCRLSGQEITRIKIKIPYAKEDVEFGSAEDFKKWGTPFAPLGGRPLPMEVNNLLREALLLTLDAKRAHDIVTAAHEKIEPGSRSDEGPAFRPPEGPVESQSAASRVRRAGPLQPTAAMLLGRR